MIARIEDAARRGRVPVAAALAMCAFVAALNADFASVPGVETATEAAETQLAGAAPSLTAVTGTSTGPASFVDDVTSLSPGSGIPFAVERSPPSSSSSTMRMCGTEGSFPPAIYTRIVSTR